MSRFFIGVLLFLTTLFAGAQLVEPVRLEIPSRIDVPLYNTIPLAQKGVLLFYESNELTDEGKRKWFFNLFDSVFNEQWLQYVGVTDGLVLVNTQQLSNQTLFLFAVPENKKSRVSSYEILKFEHASNSFQLLGGTLPEKSGVAGFAAVSNKVLIGLNLPKYQTDLLLYDLDRLTVGSISHGITGQSVVQKLQSDTATSSLLTGIKRFESGRYVEDVFLVFDPNGKLINRFSFSMQSVYLHSYIMHLDTTGKLIVVGSYDDNATRRNAVRDALEGDELNFESKGLFYLSFSPNGMIQQKFHPFSTFSQIFRALPTEKLMRARQKQARGKETGAGMDISFQFYNPGLFSAGNNLVFAAEAFQPQYRTETRMDYDFYGRLVPYTYTIFEGYNFFSALIASFDAQGNIRWSNDLKLDNILLPYLHNVTSVTADKDDVVAAYLTNGVLTSKVFDGNGTEKGQTEQSRVETTYKSDRVTEDNFSEISFWYDNYYIIKGYQQITNNRLHTDNSRKVLYLQKMVFE